MAYRQTGIVEKGWGHENIFVTKEEYCGKLLVFNTDSKCSMHYHLVKDETWYIQSGKFIVKWIDTNTSTLWERELVEGDTWENPPGMPHQVFCKEAGTIFEVSTEDDYHDNYRIEPGDSQLKDFEDQDVEVKPLQLNEK